MLWGIADHVDCYYKRGIEYLPKLEPFFDQNELSFDYPSYLKAEGAQFKGNSKNFSTIEEAFVITALTLFASCSKKQGVYDWIIQKGHGITGEQSARKFVKIQSKDIQSGNLDHAIRRAVSFLLFAVMMRQSEALKKDWPHTGDRFEPMVMYIEQSRHDEKDFSEEAISDCANSIISLLAVMKQFKLLDYLFSKDVFDLPSKTAFEIANVFLNDGNITKAKEYARRLSANDPLSHLTASLEKDIVRREKLLALSISGIQEPQDLHSLSGIEFEKLIEKKFSELNYQVESTPITGDYGADIILTTRNETRIVVQCKRYREKLNLRAVQEVTSGMSHYAGDYGLVITTNGYLASAIELAKSADVELWDADKLLTFLSGDLSFSELPNL